MQNYNSVPAFVNVVITEENVEKTASKLSGSGGLNGFDSVALKNVLLQRGQASRKLRQTFAKFASWLANDFPPWAAYRALMWCREIALDKMPGVRPIGIGDIFRRFIAKLVLVDAGPYATDVCGSDQLAAGLKSGVDGAIHGMSALLNKSLMSDEV